MGKSIDIEVNTGDSLAQFREMRQELNGLRGEMANAEGEEFQKLSQRSSELNAKIARTNSLVTSSGSSFTNFNTMLGRTSKSLLTLDFDQAAEQANQLLVISKQLTFKTMVKGMKTATGVIKTMGKALLANPIFLIAGIIIAVGVALYKLRDSIKPVKVMFDMIGKAIDMVVQALKDFLDWIGITSFAEDEANEKAAKGAERRAEAVKRANRSIEADMGREIELMKAQGAEIEEIEAAEIRLAKIKIDNFKEEVRREKIKLSILEQWGVASDEQLDAMAEMNETLKQMNHDLEMTELRIQDDRQKREDKAREDGIKAHQKYVDKLREIEETSVNIMQKIEDKKTKQNIDKIEDEIKREEKLQLFKLEQEMRRVDKTKLNKEALLELEQWFEDEKARIQNEAIDKEIKRIEEADEEKEQKKKDLREAWDKLIEEERELTQEERFESELESELEHLRNMLEQKAITQEEFDQMELERKNALTTKLSQLEKDRLEKESDLRKEAQMEAVDSGVELFDKMAELAEEGSAAQKAAALVSIIAANAESLAKAVPVAMEAATGTGPAAPFVFGATLAGIIGTIAGSIGSAKSVLNSAPGNSPSGGGGGSTPRVQPMIQGGGNQPSFNNFQDDFAGDMNNQGDTDGGFYILDNELSSREERKEQIKRKTKL